MTDLFYEPVRLFYNMIGIIAAIYGAVIGAKIAKEYMSRKKKQERE